MASCSALVVLASGIMPELSQQFELVYLETEVCVCVINGDNGVWCHVLRLYSLVSFLFGNDITYIRVDVPLRMQSGSVYICENFENVALIN